MSTRTVEKMTEKADRTSALRFMGKTLEEAVAKAEAALETKIVVVSANRVRRGGFAGFFATEVGVEIEAVPASGKMSTSFEEIVADAVVEHEKGFKPARVEVDSRSLPDTSWLDEGMVDDHSRSDRPRRNGLATTWRRKAQAATAAEENDGREQDAPGTWWSPPSKESDGRRYASILDVIDQAAAVGVELSTKEAEELLESHPDVVGMFKREPSSAVRSDRRNPHMSETFEVETLPSVQEGSVVNTESTVSATVVEREVSQRPGRGVASLATPSGSGVGPVAAGVSDEARERLMSKLAAALFDDGFLRDEHGSEVSDRLYPSASNVQGSDTKYVNDNMSLVAAIASAAAVDGPESMSMVVPVPAGVERDGGYTGVVDLAAGVDAVPAVGDGDAGRMADGQEVPVSGQHLGSGDRDQPAASSRAEARRQVAVFDAATEARVADVLQTGAAGARRRRQQPSSARAGAAGNSCAAGFDDLAGVAETVVSQLRTEGTRRISVRVSTASAAGENVAEIEWEGC